MFLCLLHATVMAPLVHLGVIPDGNRRWCKETNASVDVLIGHHWATLDRVMCMGAEALWEHPSLSRVGDVSMYMLSADNLLKRGDETRQMVFDVLLRMERIASAGAAGRAAARRLGPVRVEAGEPRPPDALLAALEDLAAEDSEGVLEGGDCGDCGGGVSVRMSWGAAGEGVASRARVHGSLLPDIVAIARAGMVARGGGGGLAATGPAEVGLAFDEAELGALPDAALAEECRVLHRAGQDAPHKVLVALDLDPAASDPRRIDLWVDAGPHGHRAALRAQPPSKVLRMWRSSRICVGDGFGDAVRRAAGALNAEIGVHDEDAGNGRLVRLARAGTDERAIDIGMPASAAEALELLVHTLLSPVAFPAAHKPRRAHPDAQGRFTLCVAQDALDAITVNSTALREDAALLQQLLAEHARPDAVAVRVSLAGGPVSVSVGSGVSDEEVAQALSWASDHAAAASRLFAMHAACPCAAAFVARAPSIDVRFVGERHLLPARQREAADAIEAACDGDRATMRVVFALAYDPVEDCRAVLLGAGRATQAPIDVVVRSGGEMRSSGFFPLHTLYSEWVYLPTFFPDVGLAEVEAAVRAYSVRTRRFGA